jgi:cob(I)alamin adenosyltransferase
MENWKKYLEFDEEPVTKSVERQPTFHWTMPLETFHDDMKSVQNDIFSLGNDLVGQGIKKAKEILQCNENEVHVRSFEEAYVRSFEDIRSFDITSAETETFEEEKSDYGFY